MFTKYDLPRYAFFKNHFTWQSRLTGSEEGNSARNLTGEFGARAITFCSVAVIMNKPSSERLTLLGGASGHDRGAVAGEDGHRRARVDQRAREVVAPGGGSLQQ